jgi:site-specific recombinase XerD
MDTLQKPGPKPTLRELEELVSSAEQYISDSISESTKTAYGTDWKAFVIWCATKNLSSLPADEQTVILWITYLSKENYAISSISRKLTSISQAHAIAGHVSPTGHPMVRAALKGIRREKGISQKQAKPLVLKDLKKVLDNIRPTFMGRRDECLLWLGWSAALRRSEIVAIDREHIEFCEEGLILTIPRSKTDQEGFGEKIGIPYGQCDKFCPVHAVKRWFDLSKIESGPIFFAIGSPDELWIRDCNRQNRLSARSVNNIIKKRVRDAGMSPAGYSGHSLRAGFVTSAAKAKIPEYQIQIHTRHRSSKVLRKYIRDASLFNENSLSVLI